MGRRISATNGPYRRFGERSSRCLYIFLVILARDQDNYPAETVVMPTKSLFKTVIQASSRGLALVARMSPPEAEGGVKVVVWRRARV